ncbi:aspartic peptidase domain-containing protein [Epithele typhae]|uniref:aspartic peptidase domain-containing protein n=1 Tax=Epithele typhae TaxID=378194 RepID=UPI0020072571|nr:aspartic peptidase domain-containing protein [Epithele typhae]KAH9933149.1 aspartic peptidase domain-containing protein [Epithele typhae]
MSPPGPSRDRSREVECFLLKSASGVDSLMPRNLAAAPAKAHGPAMSPSEYSSSPEIALHVDPGVVLRCLGRCAQLARIDSPADQRPVGLGSGHKREGKGTAKKGGITLPLHQRRVAKRAAPEGDIVGGSIGLGDSQDLFYTVALEVGTSTTTVNLDTGSSDLWVMSTACKTSACKQSKAAPYDVTKSFKASGKSVSLQYGDSTSGTHASGPVGYDSVTLAGLNLPDQTLAAINDTDNSAVSNGGAGILGLGFPSQSFVQAAAISAKFPSTTGTDTFITETATYGPMVPRMIYQDMIDDPLFAITLQRNTIDVSGEGQITIGQLPDNVTESNITWVPVRLYASSEGGMAAPSFAPNEIYPLRWEIELDAVFLDGKQLPNSAQPGAGQNSSIVSALIDTGNSLIRGPSDVVNNIYSTVSPAFAASSSASPTLPCDAAHDLVFQIGGKKFPVDARDFVSQNTKGDASTCIANNIVATDAPSNGALFSWNLGDPFLKSNMVIFYYGNLTHPSVDPPRIGFVSLVPENDNNLLEEAVKDAQQNDGNFDSKCPYPFRLSPCASADGSAVITEGGSASQTAAPSSTAQPASSASNSGTTTTVLISSASASASPTESTKGNAAGALRLPAFGAAFWTPAALVSLSLFSSLFML